MSNKGPGKGTAKLRLDHGTRHVLVWCATCPPYRTLTGTPVAAHLEAAHHATLVHADADTAAEHRRRAAELR